MTQKLPDSIAEGLLDRLSHDDVFRELFVESPRDALAALGFEPARDATIKHGIWNCLFVNQLASKEEFRTGLNQLRAQFKSVCSYNPIALGFRAGCNKAAA
jgi:putative modified peptide